MYAEMKSKVQIPVLNELQKIAWMQYIKKANQVSMFVTIYI